MITDIGFDHMHILGNTLKEITAQKVGIVHKNNPLLMYKQNEEIMDVINKSVKEQDAKTLQTSEEKEKLYTETQVFQKCQTFKNELAACLLRLPFC